MMDLTLIEYLGLGGFILSLFSIGLTIILEARRTKGNIQVNIKSVTKTVGLERSYLNCEVEIVNKSLEKRYIRTVLQHNMLGRWKLFVIKMKENKTEANWWYIKENFKKYPGLERGEELILNYKILYPNENFSKKVFLKFSVIDSFGKKYKSKGFFVIPSELPEKSERGGLQII